MPQITLNSPNWKSIGISTMFAALSCLLLTTMVLERFGDEAIAASKSAISPELISPTENIPAAPEAISPEPALVEPAVVLPDAPRVESRIESAPRVIVTTPSSVPNSANYSPNPEPQVAVVLENRGNGCRTAELTGVQSNLCAIPVPTYRQYEKEAYSGNYAAARSYEFSGIRATVRPLAKREIQLLSLLRLSNLGLQNLGDRQMSFPLSVPAVISSSFGYRVHPVTQAVKFHQGTDLAAPEGTPVLAAYSGKVEISGWLGGLGLAVVISHENNLETRYGHMSEVLVQAGQWVNKGTVIGLVGSTGMSTGPHLHFELWQNLAEGWTAIDPSPNLVAALDQLNRYIAQLSKSNPA